MKRSPNRFTDTAASTIVSTVLLLALTIISFSILTATVIAYTDEVSHDEPKVKFQPSADERYIYHRGGELLSIPDMKFYDKDGNEVFVSTEDGSNTWIPGKYIFSETPVRTIVLNGGENCTKTPCSIELSLIKPEGDMVPDNFKIPKSIDNPPPTPKYSFSNLAEWELLIDELKHNIYNDTVCCKVSYNWNPETKMKDLINEVQMPVETLLQSTNDGTEAFYYVAYGPSASLFKIEAENDISIKEYADRHGESNMILVDFSRTYTKDSLSNGKWLTPYPKRGAVYEYENDGVTKVYLAIQDVTWEGQTNPLTASYLWRLIGHKN